MRQVMVLGGSGFIGRQCVKDLLKRDDVFVHGISRVEPEWISLYPGRISWHKLNILDVNAMHSLISDVRPSHALHLAWYSGHGTIWVTPENLDWAAATLHFARSFVAAGCNRLVIAGTCAEYSGSGIFSEDNSSKPETLYGKSKAYTRVLVESMCKSAEVSFAWPRLFHMYGPHESPKRLVSGAICSLIKGEDFSCSDGGQVRDFLHVEDAGRALSTLLLSPVQGVINIGSGERITIASLLNAVGEALGRAHMIKLGARPRALNDPDSLVPDLTRQAMELKWKPTFDCLSGVADTVRWWVDHG